MGRIRYRGASSKENKAKDRINGKEETGNIGGKGQLQSRVDRIYTGYDQGYKGTHNSQKGVYRNNDQPKSGEDFGNHNSGGKGNEWRSYRNTYGGGNHNWYKGSQMSNWDAKMITNVGKLK